MASPRLLKLVALLALVPSVYASGRRNLLTPNSTTIDLDPFAETDIPNFKPHIESSATDLGLAETGRPPGRAPDADIDLNDPVPTTPCERRGTNPRQTGCDFIRPHLEWSTTGFGEVPSTSELEPQVTASPIGPPVLDLGNGKKLRPVPITSIVIEETTLTPDGGTVTLGDGQTKVHLDKEGKPVVVVGTSTSTQHVVVTIGDKPATSLSDGLVIERHTLTRGGNQVTLIDGPEPVTVSIDDIGQTLVLSAGRTSTLQMPATQTLTIAGTTITAKADQYKFAITESTLEMGDLVTVENTVFAMSTDSTGAPVLVAGPSTMALSPAETGRLPGLQTTVISGTTRFIMGPQTLAPDNPITVDGTPISMSTGSGATVLVVGTMTTTIRDPSPTGTPGQDRKDTEEHSNAEVQSGSRATVVITCTTLVLVVFATAFFG